MVHLNFPELGFSWVSPKTLTAPNRKVRRYTKKKLKKLKASIAEFKWVNPLIVDENGMVLLICPPLSGPETMIVWTTKGTRNAEQEAQAGRDHRQAA